MRKRVFRSLFYGIESTDWDAEFIRQDRRYIQPACAALLGVAALFIVLTLLNMCHQVLP